MSRTTFATGRLARPAQPEERETMTVDQLHKGATYQLLSAQVLYCGVEHGVIGLHVIGADGAARMHRFETGHRVELVSEPFLVELCASGLLIPVVGA